jgi:hypothetical protein
MHGVGKTGMFDMLKQRVCFEGLTEIFVLIVLTYLALWYDEKYLVWVSLNW